VLSEIGARDAGELRQQARAIGVAQFLELARRVSMAARTAMPPSRAHAERDAVLDEQVGESRSRSDDPSTLPSGNDRRGSALAHDDRGDQSESRVVSTTSKSASLSSCKSLLYASGRFFTARAGRQLSDRARRLSAQELEPVRVLLLRHEDEPVATASDSSRKPASVEAKKIQSSASARGGRDQRTREAQLAHVIAVAHRVEAVCVTC
jgi:hypothetical protein